MTKSRGIGRGKGPRKGGVAARFQRFVEAGPRGCSLWTGQVDARGYGVFWLNGRNERAHRAAWIIANGPIPPGMVICHRCDTPACVSLGHLFLGTQADNIADKVSKERQARGEGHGNAVLTTTQVQEILDRYEAGERQVDIAATIGTDRATVWRIVHRRAWRHVGAVA